MNFSRAYTIFLRQFFLLRRSLHRVMGIFYWSALELFLWGFLTVYLNKLEGSRLSFISILIGTVILWNFLMRVQQGLAISFLEDVWARNFMNLFASPLTIYEYVLGLVFISVFSSVIATAFMMGLAWILFAYNLFQFGILMVPFVFILFFFGLSLGMFTVAVILRFGPSSEILAWSIPALLPPFSGVFYPISQFPAWLQGVAGILPSTYVFEGMRKVVLEGFLDQKALVWAGILSLIWFFLCLLFLIRMYGHVLREGKLTRFITE